jgi:hypothetical protein
MTKERVRTKRESEMTREGAVAKPRETDRAQREEGEKSPCRHYAKRAKAIKSTG